MRSILAVVIAAAFAAMGAGLISAQTAEPRFSGEGLVIPVGTNPTWDESSTDIYFANNRIQGAATESYGWSPSLTGRVLNGRNGDILIVTVKKGRRELGSHRCQVQASCDQRSMLTEGRADRCGQNGSFSDC